ncbi:MAG: C-GCAxxG-C-C family protein [Chitinispirillaceae bacterium]
MNHSDKAAEYFQNGFNCAQSVLVPFADELGMPEDTALRIAGGFGAGMGRNQEVCGAVSGAVMAIGLVYGRGKYDDPEKKNVTYDKVRGFMDAFRKENGAVTCRDLLPGCDLMTEEGQKLFTEKNLKKKCEGFVRSACGIVERILGEEQK